VSVIWRKPVLAYTVSVITGGFGEFGLYYEFLHRVLHYTAQNALIIFSLIFITALRCCLSEGMGYL